MICEKCKNDFSSVAWEKDVTYFGIDHHHSPPQFMLAPWKGEIINLCRECHRKLHDKVIIKILNEGQLKFVNSEHWAWIKIIPNKRKEIIEKIIISTKRWLKNDSPPT